MARINFGRVLLGGLVAGVIIDVFEYVINGILFAKQWTEVLASLNRPEFTPQAILWFNLIGLVTGIIAVFIYAAIRPRFGAGPRTAVIAAMLTWATVYVMADAAPAAGGIFPVRPMIVILAIEIVEMVVATLAGAWLYREKDGLNPA